MAFSSFRLACLVVAGLATAAASHAESFASSASSAGSASVGSLSDSIKGSSNSSSGNNKVAEGDYKIIEVAALPERPGMLRLTLRQDDEHEFFLELPQQALGTRGAAAGDTVSAHYRPYGLEFARADTREPFFLVLADDWRRELDARPVSL